MLKDMSMYLPNDEEFTFRQGYSYECEIDDKSGEIIVWNIDKSVEVRLSIGEMDGLVE